MLGPFKEARRTFERRRLRDWNIAIRFFAKNKAVIEARRNTYGAHVQAVMARYILGLVEHSDETVGALEVKLTDDHQHRYVFKFAETLVNVGLFFDVGEKDRERFMRENMELVTKAIRNAAMAIQALADHYILPTFGW